MKKILILLLLSTSLHGCYQAPAIQDFEKELWLEDLKNCNSYRKNVAREIVGDEEKKSKILGSNQNEMKQLFGEPDKHQLFNRNQKFFFYKLDCEDKEELSIRFDALGRVKELQIIEIQ